MGQLELREREMVSEDRLGPDGRSEAVNRLNLRQTTSYLAENAVSLKLDSNTGLAESEIAEPVGGGAGSNDHIANGNGDAPSGEGFVKRLKGDARAIPIDDDCVDLVVTSPPYWKKRDYGVEGQIGQEETAQDFVDAMVECLQEWRRILRRTGSVFLNIGDSFQNRRLIGIPARVELAAGEDGWIVRNRIIWAKDGGMPDPAQNRLANRHEYIIHLTLGHDYYYDLLGYSAAIGNGANPGDVWKINPGRHMGDHLAPFPTEIAERAIRLACPKHVCTKCATPRRRIIERTTELDPNRPQARRAMEIAREAGLTKEHLQAVQATGVSDAGKALKTQNGTGRNSEHVKVLAAEAKVALGGYFREFTFAKRVTTGWTACNCRKRFEPGVVLDPFMGTGTTLETAREMGRSAIGIDLAGESA
jgi:DNA modification methylase